MKIKAVSVLNGGEILAEPILTEEKEILIPKGTKLKEDYVPLIQSLGIDSLMVEDPYENYEIPQFISSPGELEKMVSCVRKLMEGHIYHSQKSLREFEIIANDVVKQMEKVPENVVIDLKERNADLYEHTVMVTLLSVLVAKKLKLDSKIQYNVAVGCLLHDIGLRYITVPYKNRDISEADAAENFEYKKHTILGYSALDNENWIPEISRKMILSHHENIKGTGFPMKQKNKEVECRILQACDAFDCAISGMECRRVSVQQALQDITDEADILYEKKIVENLVSGVARYPVGTTVKTNGETKGVVISQTVDPDNPIIMLLDKDFSEENEKFNKLNLMLEKNISILHVV